MEDTMDDEATQQATQQVLDPRRLGRNNSGLTEDDVSDVLCILHPTTPAAFRIVVSTAARSPEHVLQNGTIETFDDEIDPAEFEEQETFVLRNSPTDTAQDLALRFSSRTKQPFMGFCFGRNQRNCDIILDMDSFKRVSNLHFRIFLNESAVLMLEDMSTNGTLVDEKHLKGKGAQGAATRMLSAGSIIQIPSIKPEELVKFIVRIPSRAGHYQEYSQKLQAYMTRMDELNQQYNAAIRQQARLAGGYNRTTALVTPSNPFGMHWDGGDEFNVVGLLGKGAFATVYMLATKLDGQYFAAKELEKKRFIKNGRLDQRLDNEMQIMKSIRHKNIVQYINYQDHADHLYIIMEYVPCGDLQGYLGKNTTLPEKEAKLMSRQVLEALHYLHDMQITHRDIKPDNILISCYDPFTVKLSDFGLSKVVNTNETFLKTFCGTLLYCAPEVFPHYEDHVTQKGVKRRRSGNPHQGRYHSYSQSVDIWSFAAVLWLSLCGKPPFEGVVDTTGKGMFNKIMETRLDISPLLAHGISQDALDLLCGMLNTDPAKRPNEIDCLQHPWLFDPTIAIPSSQDVRYLRAISEEADGGASVEGQARAFSQLSVNDRPTRGGAETDLADVDEEEVEFDSADFDFLDPRVSKRAKPDLLVPRDQIRDQAAMASSSPEHEISFSHEDAPINDSHVNFLQPQRQPRLFGEIGDSALENSDVLGAHTNAALAMNHTSLQPAAENRRDLVLNDSNMSLPLPELTSDLFRSDGLAMAHPSLLGTESMVRDLNMESPSPGVSGDAASDSHSNEPRTPRTPELFPEQARNTKSPSQPQRPSQDLTPKQKKKFDRQIKLPLLPDYANDGPPTIPNTTPNAGPAGLPDTMHGSLEPNRESKSTMPTPSTTPANVPSDAMQPPPRLGKLTSTVDSISTICLRLNDRMTHWGRHPANTFVYPNRLDTRIPKRAFIVWFHAYGIDKEERAARDWTQMQGLHTIISTVSRNGIWVNGIPLTQSDEDGTDLCGRLYTGDIITIFADKEHDGKPAQALRFVCEFYVGEAKGRRPVDSPFEAIRAVEPSQRSSA